jgi:hypothetical protein
MTRLPASREAGKGRQDELARDATSSKNRTRPVDEGLAALRSKGEDELIQWWTHRLNLIAEIPSDTARVGALVPQLRELSRIDDQAERKRLTRARMIAFPQLDPAKRERITEARKRAWQVDPGVLEADQKIVEELLPTLDASVRSAYPAPKP